MMAARSDQIPVEIVTAEQWVALDRLFSRLRELKKVAAERMAANEVLKN